MADGVTDLTVFVITIVVGVGVCILYFVSELVKSAGENSKQKNEDIQKISEPTTSVNTKKVTNQNNKTVSKKKNTRDQKQVSFTHKWLLTSLKGHSSDVLDMDFSPNGKFLATCGEEDTEEPDPGGGGVTSVDKENTVTKALLSRRQRKNRVQREEGAPIIKIMTKKNGRRMEVCSWKHIKLNLNDGELLLLLKQYLMTPDQMTGLGYPIESALFPGRAIIYRSVSPIGPTGPMGPMNPMDVFHATSTHLFDVNAREFVPAIQRPICEVIHSDWYHCSDKQSLSDSGDSKSSDKSDPDDNKCDKENIIPKTYDIQRTIKHLRQESDEKKCVRCNKGFFIMIGGEYLTQEKCFYHWGKLERVFTSNNQLADMQGFEYSCCKGKRNARGCSTGSLHVWSGVGHGVNGPYDGYVKTKPRKTPPPDGYHGVYAIDCEMCFTTQGLELGRVTVVSIDGRKVYDSFVKPDNTIIDYNTRFSGITAKDLSSRNAAKNLKEVQNDLMGFINAETILVGHALENDLRALKLIHGALVDTSILFPHYRGLPFRRSLRSLVSSFLKRDIQKLSSGHDSYEDARACVELLTWKVRKDLKNMKK